MSDHGYCGASSDAGPRDPGGQQQAAAPKAPLDPKVGQMSEDAKAFGPAAQPSDGERHSELVFLVLRAYSIIQNAYPDAPEGSIAGEWLRDSGVITEGEPEASAAQPPTSANAEGAQALEIARAEGKAEGLEAAARIADEYAGLQIIGTRIRSLIPAAPGGGGK